MRIRSIKPEFWQSESVGRLTRDARLVFVGLWSLADDHGRFRADPRFIAGQLFPYDDDGAKVVSRALASLREEGCVVLYESEASHYGAIPGWSRHQKIDRPSKSRLPEPPEIPIANIREHSPSPREPSCEEQGAGSRDMEQGAGSREGSAPTAETHEVKVDPTTPAERHQNLEVPTTEPTTWSAEDFWRWAQGRRRQAGLMIERWPHPSKLGTWWASARAVAEVDLLQEAFYRYGDDKFWQAKTPPLPFQGFISQWDRFLPKGRPNAGA